MSKRDDALRRVRVGKVRRAVESHPEGITPSVLDLLTGLTRPAVLGALDRLVRDGEVEQHGDTYRPTSYSTRTPLYGGTEHMRFRNPKNPRAVGSSTDSIADGAGHGSGAGAAASPSPAPVSLTERDALLLDMDGPHALALDAVRSEPALLDRLRDAIGAGMAPLDLTDTPRYRRTHEVEAGLDAWAAGTRGGPCSACGRVVGTSQGYLSRGYLDKTDGEPFRTVSGLPEKCCRHCAEYLAVHSQVELREAVFNAVAGTLGMPSDVTLALRSHPTLTPFAHEIDSAGPGPWEHITGNPLLVLAIQMRAREAVHPNRWVTTPGAAASVALPGITPPIHRRVDIPRGAFAATRVAVGAGDGTTPEQSEALDLRAAYFAAKKAMEAKHREERQAWLDAHPRAFGEEVGPEWFALLDRQAEAEERLCEGVPGYKYRKPTPSEAKGRPVGAGRGRF